MQIIREDRPRGATPDPRPPSVQWAKGYRMVCRMADGQTIRGGIAAVKYAEHLARVATSDYWRARAEREALRLQEKLDHE